MLRNLIVWFKQSICKHDFIEHSVNEGYYDAEYWRKCKKCGVEEDA